jgi:valyl-tRNA synthetase
MPFITEEIWQNLKGRSMVGTGDAGALMLSPYPSGNTNEISPEAEYIMESVIEIVRAIRNARAEYGVAASKWIEARIYTDNLEHALNAKSAAISSLSKANPLTILPRSERMQTGEKALAMVLKEGEVVLPWEGMVDVVAEIDRMEKEMAATKREIERLSQRLEDEQFLSRAPEHVVNKERDRLHSYIDKAKRIEYELAQLR